MWLFALFNHVKWMWFSISREVLMKTSFFLFYWYWNIIRGYFSLVHICDLCVFVVQNIVKRFVFQQASVRSLTSDLFHYWNVPVVNSFRLSISLEGHWCLLSLNQAGRLVRAIVDVVMGVGRKFDHKHVRIIWTAIVSGIDC